MAQLIRREDGKEVVFELGDQPVLIGRGDGAGIRIQDEKASREHFQIERAPPGYKLVDLESRNGTKVNGKVVNQQPLRDGDRIEVGTTLFEFRDHARAPDLLPPEKPVERPLERTATRRMAPRRRSSSPSVAGVGVAVAAILAGGALLFAAFLAFSSNEPDWGAEVLAAQALVDADPAQARERLRAVPATAGAAHADAQRILREMDERERSVQAQNQDEMARAFSDLSEYARARSFEWQEILNRVAEFERRFAGRIDARYEREILAIRRRAESERDRRRELDLGRLRRDVEQAIADDAFSDAWRSLQAFLEQPDVSVADRNEAVEIQRGLVEQVAQRVEERRTEARTAASEGRPADGLRILEELYARLGQGQIEIWAEACRAIRAEMETISPP